MEICLSRILLASVLLVFGLPDFSSLVEPKEIFVKPRVTGRYLSFLYLAGIIRFARFCNERTEKYRHENE